MWSVEKGPWIPKAALVMFLQRDLSHIWKCKWTYNYSKTHTLHEPMLSAAFSLLDDKQVLICWVHRCTRFVTNPSSSISLLLLLISILLCRHPSIGPTEMVWSTVPKFLRFFIPPFLLLFLYVVSFAPSSRKIICFIQNKLIWRSWVSWDGHRSFGFPRFYIASAFLFALFGFIHFGRCTLTITVSKKDMAGTRFVVLWGLVRRMVKLVVVFIMADFLFLLWRPWSERDLRCGGEIATFLQFWEKQKCKALNGLIMSSSLLRLMTSPCVA